MTLRRTLALSTILLSATVAAATVSVGQQAPPLSLEDVNENGFSLESKRDMPLVLLFTTKDLGDHSLAWHDSIHAHVNDVQIQSVLDLSDVSRFLRAIAKRRIAAKGSKAVLDWDGEVSQRWRGEDRSEVVVIAVSPDNVVRFMLRGSPEPESVGKVTRTLGDMVRDAE